MSGGSRAGRAWPALFHVAVTPNASVVNVETPPVFLRKFSPDGRWLLAFSAQQTTLQASIFLSAGINERGGRVWWAQIYEYRGVAAAGELVNEPAGLLIRQGDELGSPEIRRALFATLFRPAAALQLTQPAGSEQLNRECSLFTEDGRHVIVGASGSALADNIPTIPTWFQGPETLPPTSELGYFGPLPQLAPLLSQGEGCRAGGRVLVLRGSRERDAV